MFPAHAGMNRRVPPPQSVPRTRGDEPDMFEPIAQIGPLNVPRTRGDEPAMRPRSAATKMFPECARRDFMVSLIMFPAHAGMNRVDSNEQGVWDVPRTRGDEPTVPLGMVAMFPAHAGMNRSRPTLAKMFPAHAGMNRRQHPRMFPAHAQVGLGEDWACSPHTRG